MALISLSEAKEYLRVDTDDEDTTIGYLLKEAEVLVRNVSRLGADRWNRVQADPSQDDDAELIELRDIIRGAELYTLGYLCEHRDEADHHDLTITLRNLLFAVREGII